MKKKVLSILTALALCLSLLPATALAVCETCVDEDGDHCCDGCDSTLCADENQDHWCDVCSEWMSDLCADVDGDHYCDTCFGYLEWLCTDEDENHACDICQSVMDWLCTDEDNDHSCDNENCGNQLSECEDRDGDNVCDLCGEGIYPHAWDLDVDAEFGDGQAVVTWSPVAEQVGEDSLASYIVYIYDAENQEFEDAQTVTFTPEECPFTYTFTGLTNDVKYDVGVEAVYTLMKEGDDKPYSLDSSTSGIPVSASATVPGMPEIRSITYGDGTITVSWIAPEDNGGAMVRWYAVHADQENWGTMTELEASDFGENGTMSFTVEELTNGESYSIGVSAGNAVGWGEVARTEATIPLIPYKIQVGGVQITGENMGDVLGDGTVSYDPEERVLTLNGANISVTNGKCGIYSEIALTIQLKGENKVACTGWYGMYSKGAVTICGDGSLDISGSDFGIHTAGYDIGALTISDSVKLDARSGDVASGSSYGIRADGDLTICDDAVVTAQSGHAPVRSCGIYAYTQFDILDNAEVTLIGGDLLSDSVNGSDSYGVRTTWMSVDGGTLTATGGSAQYQSNGIYTATLDIIDGTVTAIGGVTASGPSTGIQVNGIFNAAGGVITATAADSSQGIADQSCGIQVSDAMVVTGSTINASSGKGEYTYGIMADTLSVDSGIVNAQPGVAAFYSCGIQAINGLTISGGSVNAQGGGSVDMSYGLQTTGAAEISGGKVKAVGGSADASYGLWSFGPVSITGGEVSASTKGTYAVYSFGGLSVDSNLSILIPDRGQVLGEEESFWTIVDRAGEAANVVEIGKESSSSSSGSGSSSTSKPGTGGNKPCASEGYTDLDSGAWYHDAVDYVLQQGLMIGVDEGLFAPNLEMSRNMLVTVLWKLEGKPVVDYAMSFTDVPADSWYSEAVRWAGAKGIVSGYGDGTFGIDENLTREQLATILYGYERSKDGGFTGAWMFRLDYTDIDQISEWAYEPMCWMSMKGVIDGKENGVLAPKGSVTRAEAAQMLMRYLLGQDR